MSEKIIGKCTNCGEEQPLFFDCDDAALCRPCTSEHLMKIVWKAQEQRNMSHEREAMIWFYEQYRELVPNNVTGAHELAKKMLGGATKPKLLTPDIKPSDGGGYAQKRQPNREAKGD